MRIWKGWATISAPATNMATTWDKWCARLQRTASRMKGQREGITFSDREIARLSFVRWLYQRGRIESERCGK